MSPSAVNQGEHRWPKLLVELVDVIAADLQRQNRQEALAKEEALGIALSIGEHFGGAAVYLPSGHKLRRAIRDAEIFALAGRMTIPDLARKYRVSTKTIYEAIHRQRELRRTSRASDS